MKGEKHYHLDCSANELHLIHEALQFYIDKNKSTGENWDQKYETSKIRNEIELITRLQ